eukprot:gene3920-5355_t
MMPGKGRMTVTGNLRDVMKESISAAASYVRSRAITFGIEPPLFERRDIHVDTAVILAAGAGTRLRAAAESKPLCVVAGKTLLDHALERLAAAGIARAIVVTGYRAEALEAHIAARDWPLAVTTVRSRDWQLPNGVSALAAVDQLAGRPTLLTMCDHLVEPALYARMAAAGPGPGLRLGVDRRLGHPWVDPEDVTFVATEGARIVAIGKGMAPHDCYDTGVFAVGQPFFDALAELE